MQAARAAPSAQRIQLQAVSTILFAGNNPALSDHAGHGVIERRLQPPAGFDQRRQVHSGVETHAMQHVDEIFGGNITCRGGCEGTAADSPATRIENPDTGFDGGVGVRETRIARVVEVRAQFHAGQRRSQEAKQLGDLAGDCHADGVGNGDLLRFALSEPFRERAHTHCRPLHLRRDSRMPSIS